MAFPLVALFSCRGGLSDDLDEDFSTPYSYYSEEHLDDSAAVVERYSIGETITEKDLPTVAQQDFFAMRPGYKILGWKFLKNVLSESSEPPSNIHLNDDDTVSEITVTSAPLAFVVSKWKPITYSVRFRGNGGKTNDGNTEYLQSNFVYDDEQALIPNAFARDNYDFVGWGKEAECSPNWPDFADEHSVLNLANREGTVVPLYALWLKDKITIHFDSNAEDGVGGEVTGKMDAQTFSFKQLPANLAPNSFEREGHTFSDWNTARDGGGDSYADEAEINIRNYPLDDTTLYAQWSINLYQVEFDSKEGSDVSAQIVEWNQKADEPENPTRTGYDFKGWYTSADGGDTLSDSPFDFNTPIKADLTLYAKWQMQTLKIHFDKNADDASGKMDDQTIRFDELPVQITKNAFDRTSKGYDFTHWNTKRDDTEYHHYDDRFEISEDNWDWVRGYAGGDVNLTLYAQWADILYTVHFNPTGGWWFNWEDEPWQQDVKWHTHATKPTDPTRTGYKFLGWYTSKDYGTTLSDEKFDFDTEIITQDITLYAKWSSESLVINFNANGGSGKMSPQKVDGSELGNVSISKSTFKREGYDFIGWSKDKKATTEDFVDSEPISQLNWDSLHTADEITLYAVWEAITYQVKFDTNGGSWIQSQTVKWNERATRPADPTRTGYKFLGWYEDDTLTKLFDFDTEFDDSKYPPPRTLTLYAKWEPEKLVINFHANDGKGEMPPQTITYDQLPVQINAAGLLSKEGYNFDGWATSVNGEKIYDNCEWITVENWAKIRTGTETINLYAKWKIQTFTVTFNANNGSAVTSTTVDWKKTVSEPTAPTRTGYKFLGWYTSKDYGTTLSDEKFDFDTEIITQDITLYAKWEPEKLIINFHANDGEGEMPPQTITYDQLPVQINAVAGLLSNEGHNFDGWATSRNGEKIYDNCEWITVENWAKIRTSETINLYAKWKIQTFTVTFETRDGSKVASQTVKWNESATRPADPTRTGYIFKDWYTSDDEKFDFDTEIITQDITLYADWEPETLTVIFDKNGGTGAQMPNQVIEYDKLPVTLSTNTYSKSGSNFNVWNTQSDGKGARYSQITASDWANIRTGTKTTIMLYATWAQRAKVTPKDGFSKSYVDEGNEKIIFKTDRSYISLIWIIDGKTVEMGSEGSIDFDSEYADGKQHSILIFGKDENGNSYVEVAYFTIEEKK